MANTIINIFKPMLHPGEASKSENGAELDQKSIQSELEKVNQLLKDLLDEDNSLTITNNKLQVEKNTEIPSYEKDVEDLKAVMTQLMEHMVEEDQNNSSAYLEYMRLDNENLKLKREIAQLKLETDRNPPESAILLEERYEKLQKLVQKLEEDVKAEEKSVEEYSSLGQPYMSLLNEFQSIEEQIRTKEWVKEQLDSSSSKWDKSLNDESFF